MGLFFAERSGIDIKLKAENDILHEMGCRACPLVTEPGDMAPTGTKHPLIYILGEGPTKTEAEEGEHFLGKSGDLLRDMLPDHLDMSQLRWNNVVRSHPRHNRDPDRVAIECCRPSVVADIEQTKPKVIFGFGNVPLNWVSGMQGIRYWRGRRMPVRIGTHTCWYYAFFFSVLPRQSDD